MSTLEGQRPVKAVVGTKIYAEISHTRFNVSTSIRIFGRDYATQNTALLVVGLFYLYGGFGGGRRDAAWTSNYRYVNY